jgi:hypothetical protein
MNILKSKRRRKPKSNHPWISHGKIKPNNSVFGLRDYQEVAADRFFQKLRSYLRGDAALPGKSVRTR